MRRQPVYVLVDCSQSMAGEPIDMVKTTLLDLVSGLRADPQALESVWISVIAFSSHVSRLCPLTSLADFRIPDLHVAVGGGCALGAALEFLCACARSELQGSSPSEKGDWRPLVFIMSAGQVTDDLPQGVAEFERCKWGVVMCCAAGKDANVENLKRIASDGVCWLSTVGWQSSKHYFTWVSSSISSSSGRIDAGKDISCLDLLPPPPPDLVIDGDANAVPASSGGVSEHSEGEEPVRPEGAPKSVGYGAFDPQAKECLDPVDCSLYAPPEVLVGASALVQVYVHFPDRADEARSMAQEFDSDSRRRGFSSLGTRIPRGERLTFDLSFAGLSVENPVQELVWQGRTEYVQYLVQVPPGLAAADLYGKLRVSQETVPIGQIIFKIGVVTGGRSSGCALAPAGLASRYSLAFISYASKDRLEVLRRVQMLSAAGIRFFQDVMDLDPGDRWAEMLYRRIDESDVMFLFWSSAAKDSEWVAKEWRYGLERKGEDYVRPVLIEGPPVPEPPPELRHLHFSDRTLFFMKDSE